MKNKIRAAALAALVAAAFICALIVSACDGGKDVTLTVWCAEKEQSMISAMAEEFMAANPGVKAIEVVVCEDSEARERFEGAPGEAADVFCIPHDQLGALVAQNALLEITDERHLTAIGANSAPSVSAGRIEGRQYGFPSSFETHMLFYDKSIVSDAAARSLDGILSGDPPENGFHFAMNLGNAYFSANWFFTFGCRLFGESGEDAGFCDFDSAGGIAAMTYLIEHKDRIGNLTTDEAIDLFRQHRLGAYIDGPWSAAGITEALGGNYGCSHLPVVSGMDMKSFAGFKLYCVNANASDKAAALDLAAWLTNPASQKTRFQERYLIPVATQLVDDPDVAASTSAKALMSQGPHAIAMPSIPGMSNFWTPTGDFTLACFNGEIAIAELPEKLGALVAAIKGN